MKNGLIILGLTYFPVGVAVLLGFSEGTGLFGAINLVGLYILNRIDQNKRVD